MCTMVHVIDTPLLERVSERIERRTGLHFPRERFADLERGLAKTAHEAGCGDVRAYALSLLDQHLAVSDVDRLVGSLAIGESHFFRDATAFTFLETTVLPTLIAMRRADGRCLRILSAGCAAGEEPYSIAMLLHRLMPDLDDWHITILGADINPKALARAAAGIYSEWSFRDTPEWVKQEYFVPIAENRYKIQPRVKRMVTFSCLNLADDVYPSDLNNTCAFDLIMCRNVLIYFAPARILEVVRRFHCALVEDGQLVLGSVEASQMTFPEFTPLTAQGMAMYRRKRAVELGAQEAAARAAGGQADVVQPGITGEETSVQKTREQVHTPSRPAPRYAHPAPAPKVEWDTVLTVADNLFAAGCYSEARTVLLSAADSGLERNSHAAALLAQCYVNLGEFAEALAWCESALASAKTDAELHFLHAGILQGMNRHEDALVALRNVLFLNPRHVLAQLAAANLHRRKGRLSAAARHVANLRHLLANRNENEAMLPSGGFIFGMLNAVLATVTGQLLDKDVFAHE